MTTILIKHKDKTIAKLSCSAELPGRTFAINEAELEDWLDDQIGDGWGRKWFFVWILYQRTKRSIY